MHLKQEARHVVPLQKIRRCTASDSSPYHRDARALITRGELRLSCAGAGQTGFQCCFAHRAAAADFAEAADIKPEFCGLAAAEQHRNLRAL